MKPGRPPQNLPILKTPPPPTAPHDDPPLVLGLSPTSRGLAYVVMEGPRNPLDWGIVTARVNKNPVCIKRLKALCDFYSPHAIAIEKPDGDSRRSMRIKALLKDIHTYGHTHQIYVAQYKKDHIRDLFARFGATTKHEIAEALSEWLPSLKSTLPPERKIWESEHYQMAVFDAATFAIAFYFASDERS